MVRVLIERRVAEGMIQDFHLILQRVRLEAVQKPGYVSGESWRNARNKHHYVVISTWTSRDAWEDWEASEERRKMMVAVAPMLEEPEKVTILEPL